MLSKTFTIYPNQTDTIQQKEWNSNEKADRLRYILALDMLRFLGKWVWPGSHSPNRKFFGCSNQRPGPATSRATSLVKSRNGGSPFRWMKGRSTSSARRGRVRS